MSITVMPSLLVLSPVQASDPVRQEQASLKSPAEQAAGGVGELELIKILRACMGDDGGDDKGSRIQWLRSQIVGGEAEFDTPFGRRRITYSDHTASGRFLEFVEGFLRRHVLPFYGQFPS